MVEIRGRLPVAVTVAVITAVRTVDSRGTGPCVARTLLPLDANYWQGGHYGSLAQVRRLHWSVAITERWSGCCTLVLHIDHVVA
jgi:hypothetical protein